MTKLVTVLEISLRTPPPVASNVPVLVTVLGSMVRIAPLALIVPALLMLALLIELAPITSMVPASTRREGIPEASPAVRPAN